MTESQWPPEFSLDQERILNLLTGDRFYSNPGAALREAILNAIDAVTRRRAEEPQLDPKIEVRFDLAELTVSVDDNGVGMSRDEVTGLFSKVGASAAAAESKKSSVGEFGIGVVSYFMAGDSFVLHTNDGSSFPIGLEFSRAMLAGGAAAELTPSRHLRGTTLTIRVKNTETFDVLKESFPHWCRDVDGLSGILLPEDRELLQGSTQRWSESIELELPGWIERAHVGPVSNPTGWEAMTGASTIAVLYRGVFVTELTTEGLWGIEGSIDVDPKHFKPRLNREGFVEGPFQAEVEAFLRQCHPKILEAMSRSLTAAIEDRLLDKWSEKRWANLWLRVPRGEGYEAAAAAWDEVFRTLPAFELATGNNWDPLSLDSLLKLGSEVYVAPLADARNISEVASAALRFLRHTGKVVIRGIRRDNSWMRLAPNSYATTADLISAVFATALPPLVSIEAQAENIISGIQPVGILYSGPPAVELVRLGADSPALLRLADRLVLNVDNDKGQRIAQEALDRNGGAEGLYAIVARLAHEQLTQLAASIRTMPPEPEILSPLRRRHVRERIA